ncbi:MAG: hypothetical protein ABW110_19820 [Steroidobacteraceae bacterium]
MNAAVTSIAVASPYVGSAGTTASAAQTGSVVGLFVLLLTCTVLQRFGLTLGEISVSLALFAMYAVLGMALLSDRLEISPARFIAYCVCVATVAASMLVNNNLAMGGSRTSLPSMLLLIVMYLPLVFRIITTPSPGVDHAPIKYFCDIAFVCAIAGILQFYAQYFIRADWLFDFSPYIPPMFRVSGEFNTTISVGANFKSNGFFFREPSGFSYVAALGFIIEWLRYKRPVRLCCLALALLLSYSGTGLLTLLIALVFPLGIGTFVRLSVVAFAGALFYAMLGDVLNLSFTLERIGELDPGATQSSGYMRYIGPMRFIAENLDATPWSLWLGYGSGAISRASRDMFIFHDPTWAKLLYEYGILGFVSFLALTIVVLRTATMEGQIKAVFLLHWLIMGGLLLKAECVAMTFAFFALYSPPAVSSLDASAREPAAGGRWSSTWIGRRAPTA